MEATADVTSSSRGDLPCIDEVGITEIYCPPSVNNTIADIVFVHGLEGHPLRTWQYGEESRPKPVGNSIKRFLCGKTRRNRQFVSDNSGRTDNRVRTCFWPFDLLPNAPTISQTRIMVYGYDSHPTHFYKSGTTRMNITQHAEDLLHKIAGMRSECRGRPLIFIAHSLGGILVKGALSESKANVTRLDFLDVKVSCRGIIFMGTPHLGADLAGWGETITKIVGALPGGFTTYSGILGGLKPDSETLYTITRGFNDMLDNDEPFKKNIQICCVQEGTGLANAKGFGAKVSFTQSLP
jgi:hypothetical protein